MRLPDLGNILIADDEPAMRNLLQSVLHSHGLRNIQLASNGQQAADMLAKDDCRIDLAFIDLHMPGLSGLEVLALAKTLRPQCYCVVVSGNSDVSNVMAAIRSGARGFIVKPYTVNKVSDILQKFCRDWAELAAAARGA
ncbi:response regulator transcription factor [Rugamonas apoptosis]|uniref:Response regulator n=1 Tax=Rugamonas apoptosis TaxID=2758570 RepID=A0A7W2FES8_9BURK|nr:response regulator [Rugamonas apoptosis]MBA5690355.1 response regulator [Rugamonas apoptosis]